MINASQSPLLQVDELNLHQQLTSDEWTALFPNPQDAQGNIHSLLYSININFIETYVVFYILNFEKFVYFI